MQTRRYWQSLVAVFALIAMLCQGTLVLAGTTGELVGTVTNATTNAPIAGAKVTAASPSQVATATTDGSGHFAFLSLAPDTYLVSIEKDTFQASTITGVTITADNSRSLTQALTPALKVIGRVSTRAASSLVKAGTVSDVYSIDATTQEKSALAGGGGTQNSAFSALSTVPGVYVAPGQNGYIGAGASLSIRGGDYDQIGYEIDGVPVNRAFDNYPSGPTSSLGQQELQVYTGGGPANSEAQGLSGFINQVIRTGTNPGFTDADISLGGPAFYHKLSFETGGATTNRNFSYYIGIGGYDQDYRINDNFNGSGVGQLYGVPLEPCPATPLGPSVTPSCYSGGRYTNTNVYAYNSFLGGTVASFLLEPANAFSTSEVQDRDNVINLHLGIPRKNGLKDDVQFLGMVNYLKTYFYDSTNDLGGANYLNQVGYSGGQVPYTDGYQFNSPTGVFLPANYQSLASPYLFPYSPKNRDLVGNNIAPGLEDSFVNNQGIAKVEYTHPFSQNALFKLYGYTYYSNWLQNGAQSTYADFFSPTSSDYELSSHTRGLSGSFIDQINSQNLLQLEGSYTTASTLRDNNTEVFDGGGSRKYLGYVVDSTNPTNGLCYGYTGGVAVSCSGSAAGFATLAQAASGTITPVSGTCGGGPCQYLVTGNGSYATYNTVKPIFYGASLTDDFHPTSKISINGGIRMDIFQFKGGITNDGGVARTFFYNAYNLDHCLSPTDDLVNRDPGAACPAGDTPANFQNPAGNVTESYTEFQPRLGFTYSFDRGTVLRAAYGRYTQAPNSAFQQYDTLQANAPATLYGTYGFQKFGFDSPDHQVRPPTSNNYDFSIEHQFGGDTSIKISPFYRTTQDQIQQFFLNQQTGFVAGLNVGKQTSRGVEFEFDKGNFNRDGLAARLTATYTNSYINYTALPNGTSVIDPLNGSITGYNAYTSACGTGGALVGKQQYGTYVCGGSGVSALASPCYALAADGSATGTGVACAATGTVANPYYNAPASGLLDPKGNYATYDTFPGGVGTSANAYGAPYNATLILNYKKGPFAISPVITFAGGQRYGAPQSTYGVSPEACTALGTNSTTGDPRYSFGAQGGYALDASSCSNGAVVIPNPYSGKFDGIGAFTAPSIAQLHIAMSYDVSKKVQLTASLANVFTSCFGGSKEPWNVSGACGYSLLGGGSTGDVGNQYNPGAVIQPYLNTPYLPNFATNPFALYFSAKVKI